MSQVSAHCVSTARLQGAPGQYGSHRKYPQPTNPAWHVLVRKLVPSHIDTLGSLYAHSPAG